jgi:hypothetical protein
MKMRSRAAQLTFEISSLADLDTAAAADGPVGPRTGPNARTHETTERYVLRKFLKEAIPAGGIFELPVSIRHGDPNAGEPDFIMTRRGSTDVIAQIEVTIATAEADQKEMAAFERSGKSMMLLGTHGGRFSGASGGEVAWASDIVDAIKRKSEKAIFRRSATARHLIIYPTSNASILLFDDEAAAVRVLHETIAKEAASLAQMTNGCRVHVLGGTSCVYFDVVAPNS